MKVLTNKQSISDPEMSKKRQIELDKICLARALTTITSDVADSSLNAESAGNGYNPTLKNFVAEVEKSLFPWLPLNHPLLAGKYKIHKYILTNLLVEIKYHDFF